MSNHFKRKGFRLASVVYFLSLGALALSLFAWFSTSSTFSWFASNDNVNATGTAIKVATDSDASIEMDVYKYSPYDQDDASHPDTGHYVICKNPKPDANLFELSRYDRIFKDDNKYSPLLLKITLSGGSYASNEQIPLKIYRDKSKNKINYTKDSSTVSKDPDGDHPLSSYISSVISFKAMVYNDITDLNEVSAAATYETLSSLFADKTATSFVSALPSGSAATKSEYVEFGDSLQYSSVTVNDVATCYVYIWIDYDEGDDALFYKEDSSGNARTYKGLVNCYIDEMEDLEGSNGINVSYKLDSDITEITIKKS